MNDEDHNEAIHVDEGSENFITHDGFYAAVDCMRKEEIAEDAPMPAVISFGLVASYATEEVWLTLVSFLRQHGYDFKTWIAKPFILTEEKEADE